MVPLLLRGSPYGRHGRVVLRLGRRAISLWRGTEVRANACVTEGAGRHKETSRFLALRGPSCVWHACRGLLGLKSKEVVVVVFGVEE